MQQDSRGVGALLQTDIERVDLGEHHGRRLTGRVEHRALRIALGREWHVSLAVGGRRPVAVEVVEGARRYDVPVSVPRDPYARTARWIALLWLAAFVLGRLARRSEGRERKEGGRP
jgi:hypothetical protein